MPAGKPAQSNAMLYTVITFVALFLIATVLAVIFYVKFEDYKTQLAAKNETMDKLATSREQSSLSRLIGNPAKGKSYLGTMIDYLDNMTSAITGQIPENTTASAKMSGAILKINEAMEFLADDASATYGPEGIDLLQTIVQLKSDLDEARNVARNMEISLVEIQKDFVVEEDNWRKEEQQLKDDRKLWQQKADQVQAGFDELKDAMSRSADEQIQLYMDKLEKVEAKLEEQNMELLKTQAELSKTNVSLQEALDTIEEIKPRPDIEVAAFLPDARIIEIDLQAMVVYLDIGSENHVYKGLTFSIYDRNVTIPEDGKGKAEIEVFDVEPGISIARINTYSKKNPIVPEDIVANLIWDSKTSNSFVIAGNFDFDGDGVIDFDGTDKIKELIERWGGRVVDAVTIKTDFIVLGDRPLTLPKPSRDIIELDPMAQQKYQASLKRVENYKNILTAAGTLRVPIFNQRRFIHLIGYESLAAKSSPSK